MAYRNLKFPNESVFLVTGCAGFIGSNLCDALLTMGYKVRGLDNLSTGLQANIDELNDYKSFDFIKGDIKDLDTCLTATAGVDFVLNQAAWGSVPRSIEMPLFYCANNIIPPCLKDLLAKEKPHHQANQTYAHIAAEQKHSHILIQTLN
jgi:UDP-N-acetylglucosamine 4-epimerase